MTRTPLILTLAARSRPPRIIPAPRAWAVDAQGNVYGAVVRRQMLERHVKK